MRHQKMMTWVSIGGTALAIFLVMIFIMADRIKVVEVSPESNRSRILQAWGMNVKFDESNWSTKGMDYPTVKRLYSDLEGIEEVSYMLDSYRDHRGVSLKGGEVMSMYGKTVDGNYWKLYDFNFIAGRPFNEAESAADMKVVVIVESAARKLFGEVDVVGREMEIGGVSYKIIGVAEDVNPILSDSYSSLYIPFNPATYVNSDSFINNKEYLGAITARLLMAPGVKAEDIKSQVKERFTKLQGEMTKKNIELIYHEQPYTVEEVALDNFGTNKSPDLTHARRVDLLVYCILILLPAINLSSMTRSRLRHRVAEIGVRRAFGAKRNAIIRQILGENFIITIIGGIIGLVLSLLFMSLLFDMFFAIGGWFGPTWKEQATARPELGMLFTWSNFLWAFIFCFILNTLSASLPAWKASKVEVAQAISKVY